MPEILANQELVDVATPVELLQANNVLGAIRERYESLKHATRFMLGKAAVIGAATIGTMGGLLASSESAAADTLSYPWANAPCEFGAAGGSHCTNPSNPYDLYDWGVYVGGVFHPYRNGYEYRNCTDYVQWKESTVGVSVPSNLGNGGQWYDNAPASQKSLTPKAWDAAVVPGNPGHVAFVESTNNDGTITVSEYNHDAMGNGDVRTGTPASMGFTRFIDFGVHPSTTTPPDGPPLRTKAMTFEADFNGDGDADYAIWRPSNGDWYVKAGPDGSSDIVSGMYHGDPTDVPLVADFDGDGKADYAIYRPSTGMWYVKAGPDGSRWITYGLYHGDPTDVPIAADFNGDGKADFGIWRPSTGMWYVKAGPDGSSSIVSGLYHGDSTDVPFAADVNGDGKADYGVWRPSNGGWFVRAGPDGSTAAASPVYHGDPTDIPIAEDFNGDGTADYGIWRPSTGNWYVLSAPLATSWIVYALYHGDPTDKPL